MVIKQLFSLVVYLNRKNILTLKSIVKGFRKKNTFRSSSYKFTTQTYLLKIRKAISF